MRRRRSPSSARTTSRPADPERRARYRGRFAPSPTGPLHFGSLVAALASYADARAAGGQWLVRIEDVDVPRARPGAGDAILRALEHHGFAWDERVVWQSTRAGAYEEALRALVARGAAYGCACTRRELDALPAGPIGERVYPGTCSDGIAPARARRPRAMRVRVPEAPVAFDDRVFGREAQRLRDDVGDFIVRRSDGVFAYQLAVVVDDAAQRISDVVRGADLLASTPRQIFLQHALSLPSPRYLHVPVALDAHGTKLSKQTGADPLRGEPLSALAAAWRFLGQQAPPEPLASVDEFWRFASAQWSAARIPRVRGAPAYAADV